MKRITFVTGNENKRKEVAAILGDSTSFEIIAQKLDLPELQGSTQDIARLKCEQAAKLVQGPVMTEDTALCFHALKGLPGPYIKWFLDALGHEGLNHMLDGFPSQNRGATALCTFAYTEGPGHEVKLFEGKTEGNIVAARGPAGFGWDPIFEPTEGNSRTYAEMPKEDKNKISHRFRALEQLRNYLNAT